MKRNRKNGFTLIEVMVIIALVGLLTIIAFPAAKRVRGERIRMEQIPQGKFIAEPEAGVVYEKTADDPLASAVVAIPHDKYYTEGCITLHRVLVRVNNRAIIDAPKGILFMRDGNGQDRVVDPIQPAQTNLVDYGTDVAPAIR